MTSQYFNYVSDSVEDRKIELDAFQGLKELELEEGHELTVRLVGIFNSMIPEDMELMDEAFEDKNYEIVAQKAHKMMGSFQIFKFNEARELALNVQISARDTKNEEVKMYFPKLKKMVNLILNVTNQF